MEGNSSTVPAAAVPVSTKIPVPIIAPIPSAVSDQGPSDLRRRCSGRSASASSRSILFVARNCLPIVVSPPPAESRGPLSPPAPYRLAGPPGPFFFSLGLFEPRGSVRLGFGGCVLRAARFSLLRSALSLTFRVFIFVLYRANPATQHRKAADFRTGPQRKASRSLWKQYDLTELRSYSQPYSRAPSNYRCTRTEAALDPLQRSKAWNDLLGSVT